MSNNLHTVQCPVCNARVLELDINRHLDSNCAAEPAPSSSIKPGFFTKGKDTAKATISNYPGKRPAELSSLSHTSNCRPVKRSKTSAINIVSPPLAECLRPTDLCEFVGQEHLTGPDSLLMHLLQGAKGSTGSMILWGPSGCGKTTLARLLAKRTDAVLKELSATSSGTNEVRAVFDEAKGLLSLTGRRTILFLDEIHRFNRAQQDIFLPYVEHGHIQLIGATTENPSFKLNSTLLSRCRVFVLERLTDENIVNILDRAIERITSSPHVTDIAPTPSPPESSQSSSATILPSPLSYPQLTSKVKYSITSLSDGDARTALSLLELVISSPITANEHVLLTNLRRSVSTSYDRTGDPHYDMISALHKSVRGSDGSAALYWLARMLTAGEDPLYIARRLIVMASEDIGLADNHALSLATATFTACQNVGMPECRINLAHCVAYLSEAHKSTRSYEAYNRAEAAAKDEATAPVPIHLRNAPTRLMKELGYGKDYIYGPDYAHPVHQEYLPPHLLGEIFLKKAGDLSGKTWDENQLKLWERERNHNQSWEGREVPKDAGTTD
ncbi:P-loop containing nucleoside triphosphate hydrolase protein [Ramaria rubella]|nr:P-loop containing nucleoside triphosphate hydrolase protein [Ramaria rubella]